MKTYKRINYLDYIKGFTILLVVLGHIYSADNPIKIWIYSFHMPLFFIVSGFLSTNKRLDIITTIKKKFKSIVIPYILFGIVFLIFRAKLNMGVQLNLESFIFSLLTSSSLGALWFLPALFIIEIIFALLNKSKLNDIFKILITIILFLIGLKGNVYYSNLYLIVIYRSLVGFGFFMLGNYTFKYVKKLEVSYIIVFFMFILSINIALKNGCVDLWGLIFNNKKLYIIGSVIGSLSIVLLFKKLGDKFDNIKILSYFGFNSLIVMSTHQMLLDVINKINGIKYYETKPGFFIFIGIMIIEIFIIYIINRYFPFMIGRFKSKKLD